MSTQSLNQRRPAPPASDPAAATLGTIGVLAGAASTIASLVISGYLGMALGVVGLPLAFVARTRGQSRGSDRTGLATTAVALNILGLALGLSAQLMKAWLMSRGR